MDNSPYPIREYLGSKDDQISWSLAYPHKAYQHGAISITAIVIGSAIACILWTAISWLVNTLINF